MRAKRPVIALVVLMAMLAVVPVSAQETPRARAQDALSADVFARVDALARVAEAEGIPGEILFNKALEGAAKRVPAAMLVPAVEQYASQLRQARAALGADAGGPLLVAGADALRRGVSPALLEDLGQDQQRSPAACLVLAELVETGVAGDRALSLVREAMQRRAREQQMLDMPAEVRRLMRQGHSTQEAVEQVRRGLQRTRGGGVGPPVPPGSEPVTRARTRG